MVISANGEPKSARNVGASAPIMSSSAIDRLKTRAIYERLRPAFVNSSGGEEVAFRALPAPVHTRS